MCLFFNQISYVHMCRKWDEPDITIEEFEPLSEDDEAQLIWGNKVIKERDTLSYEILKQSNIAKLKTCLLYTSPAAQWVSFSLL